MGRGYHLSDDNWTSLGLLRSPNPKPRSRIVSKEIRKTLRFSEDEMAMIESKLSDHGLNFSEFARAAILKKQIRSRVTVDMVRQVQRVGNNLNQMVKLLHQGKGDISNLEVMRKLIEIQNQIKEFSDDR
jgi:hypothetical protein